MSEQKRDLKSQQKSSANTGAQDQTQGAGRTWKRMLSKKWVFPAMYMAAAAIILTLMWVYQDAGTSTFKKDLEVASPQDGTAQGTNPDALPTNAAPETMQWPFEESDELEMALPYFDQNASNEIRQAAMVEYEGTYTPHLGIDFSRPDDQPFDVMAVMSGIVTMVERNHPAAGNLVEITHSNGLVSVYQSLSDIQVTKDAEVKQGQVIGKAGRNELEKDLGVHLHFELRNGQNGQAVNPEDYLQQNG